MYFHAHPACPWCGSVTFCAPRRRRPANRQRDRARQQPPPDHIGRRALNIELAGEPEIGIDALLHRRVLHVLLQTVPVEAGLRRRGAQAVHGDVGRGLASPHPSASGSHPVSAPPATPACPGRWPDRESGCPCRLGEGCDRVAAGRPAPAACAGNTYSGRRETMLDLEAQHRSGGQVDVPAPRPRPSTRPRDRKHAARRRFDSIGSFPEQDQRPALQRQRFDQRSVIP